MNGDLDLLLVLLCQINTYAEQGVLLRPLLASKQPFLSLGVEELCYKHVVIITAMSGATGDIGVLGLQYAVLKAGHEVRALSIAL